MTKTIFNTMKLAALSAAATMTLLAGGPGTTGPTQVQVMNDAAAAVPVKVTGANITEPFMNVIWVTVTGADYQKVIWSNFVVPATKRAVIEHVSGQCFAAGGTQSTLVLTFTSAGQYGGHYLDGTQRTFGTNSMFTASHSLKLYMQPGDGIGVQSYRSDLLNPTNCFLQVTGYLVNAQ